MVHRSRGGSDRGVVVVWRVGFRMDFRYVGWGRSVFYRYVIIFSRSIVVKYTFQVGLAVGAR